MSHRNDLDEQGISDGRNNIGSTMFAYVLLLKSNVSASLRCLNILRYLVRSYVTRPTMTRAMTERPANTPRPIGRTESFFPGMVNDPPSFDCKSPATIVEVEDVATGPCWTMVVAGSGVGAGSWGGGSWAGDVVGAGGSVVMGALVVVVLEGDAGVSV